MYINVKTRRIEKGTEVVATIGSEEYTKHFSTDDYREALKEFSLSNNLEHLPAVMVEMEKLL